MQNLKFFGCGSGTKSKYGTNSAALITENLNSNDMLLLDCGGLQQTQTFKLLTNFL